MRFYPGTTVTFKLPALGTALVVAAKDTTVVAGIGKLQVQYSEVEVLKSDGSTMWCNEDCFI